MKALDPKIAELHTTYWDNEVRRAGKKDVFLVEGDDDRDMIEEIFLRRRRAWDRRVHIVVAGGRKHVLQRMGPKSTFPNAWGLVDRDVWSNEEIHDEKQRLPFLNVTNGWCIENIFLEPKFLTQYNPIVAAKVSSQRERWVRAGAFWWAFQRIREAQQQWQDALRDGPTLPDNSLRWAYGLPHDTLALDSASSLAESLEQRIPQSRRQNIQLDISIIADHFEQRLHEVFALPEDQQWRVGVHGKCAFDKLLEPALEEVCGKNSSWRKELAKVHDLGSPDPFGAILSVLLP